MNAHNFPPVVAAKTLNAEISPSAFRNIFRNWIGAVSVIAIGNGAARQGFTVTSVTPLSAEPASLLICVNARNSAYKNFTRGALFSVNILAAAQQEIAEDFSGRSGLLGAQRFAGGAWRQSEDGPPVLEGALASIECVVDAIIVRHSHGLVFARLLDAQYDASADALAYWRGGYRGVDAGAQRG